MKPHFAIGSIVQLNDADFRVVRYTHDSVVFVSLDDGRELSVLRKQLEAAIES